LLEVLLTNYIRIVLVLSGMKTLLQNVTQNIQYPSQKLKSLLLGCSKMSLEVDGRWRLTHRSLCIVSVICTKLATRHNDNTEVQNNIKSHHPSSKHLSSADTASTEIHESHFSFRKFAITLTDYCFISAYKLSQ